MNGCLLEKGMGMLRLEVGCYSELFLFCFVLLLLLGVWEVWKCELDVSELHNMRLFMDVFQLSKLVFINVQTRWRTLSTFTNILFYTVILGMNSSVCVTCVYFYSVYIISRIFRFGSVQLFIKKCCVYIVMNSM